jgi:hypothetical protein
MTIGTEDMSDEDKTEIKELVMEYANVFYDEKDVCLRTVSHMKISLNLVTNVPVVIRNRHGYRSSTGT